MSCPGDITDGQAAFERLRHGAAERRVPLSGVVEITERCNLTCAHCYLGSLRKPGMAGAELATQRLLTILDQATEAGCLFLLMTGGEPLLRPEFGAIYRHVRERGVMVTVFTNATLVDEEHCALFAELPPSIVEVSVYGATAATYEAVTRVPGSFARCLAGVERLLRAGVRVGLKTVLLTANHHELDAMRDLAASYEVPFRFDATISACLDGDLSPLDLRLPPEQAVAIELADEARLDQWRTHYRRLKEGPTPEGLYGCGAGVSFFFLDSYGQMFPCLMARSVCHDAAGQGFLTGWRDIMPKIRELEAGGMAVCNDCDARGVCDVCPGFVALETGTEDGRSEYLCAVGRARDAMLARETLTMGVTT